MLPLQVVEVGEKDKDKRFGSVMMGELVTVQLVASVMVME